MAVIKKKCWPEWFEKFKGRKKAEASEAEWLVLITGVDQTLHLAVLALIVIFS